MAVLTPTRPMVRREVARPAEQPASASSTTAAPAATRRAAPSRVTTPRTLAGQGADAPHPMFTLRTRYGVIAEAELLPVVTRFRAAVEGDDEVRDQLLAHYAPLLWWMVKHLAQGAEPDAALQGAILGLFEALNDPTVVLTLDDLKARINTRVTAGIQEVRRLLRPASAPERQVELARDVSRVLPELPGLTERERAAVVTPGMRGNRYEQLRALAGGGSTRLRRDMPGMDDNDDDLSDAATGDAVSSLETDARAEDVLYGGITRARLVEALGTLPVADARILVRRHGLFGRSPETTEQIAASEAASEGAIRKRLSRASARLKAVLLSGGGAPQPSDTGDEADDVDPPTPNAHNAEPGAAAEASEGAAILDPMQRYRREAASGAQRQADRLAVAFRLLATERGWSEAELDDSVRRFAATRAGARRLALADAVLARLADGGPALPADAATEGQVGLSFLPTVDAVPVRAPSADRCALTVADVRDVLRTAPCAEIDDLFTALPSEFPEPEPDATPASTDAKRVTPARAAPGCWPQRRRPAAGVALVLSL